MIRSCWDDEIVRDGLSSNVDWRERRRFVLENEENFPSKFHHEVLRLFFSWKFFSPILSSKFNEIESSLESSKVYKKKTIRLFLFNFHQHTQTNFNWEIRQRQKIYFIIVLTYVCVFFCVQMIVVPTHVETLLDIHSTFCRPMNN